MNSLQHLVRTALVEWLVIQCKASAEVQGAAGSTRKPTNQEA